MRACVRVPLAACREGDLKSALRYLKRAATLGTESMEVDNLSVTFLNLCAVLSQCGKCVGALHPSPSPPPPSPPSPRRLDLLLSLLVFCPSATAGHPLRWTAG